MGQVQDPYAEALPYDDAPLIDGRPDPQALPGDRPMARPASPQPGPAPQRERRPEALFF
ncbi:hypothetical protein D3C73_1297000 [compost metagenome]